MYIMSDERPLKGVSMDNLIDEMKSRGAEVLHSYDHVPVTISERAIIVVIRW